MNISLSQDFLLAIYHYQLTEFYFDPPVHLLILFFSLSPVFAFTTIVYQVSFHMRHFQIIRKYAATALQKIVISFLVPFPPKSLFRPFIIIGCLSLTVGFPGSSVGKESTCNAGDLGLIPWLGRSAGEWIVYPFQCSWASPVAQLVKNLPAMRETWVLSLGWEDPLGKGKATYSSILAWRISWTVQSMGPQRVGHD